MTHLQNALPIQDAFMGKVAKTENFSRAINEKASPTTAVEWYQPYLKTLPSSTLEVFKNYVGLFSEEEVKEHIYRVRDKAWQV
jgi:hypothetical protein